jgi:hypothetical protein
LFRLFFHLEAGGSMFLRNVTKLYYTAQRHVPEDITLNLLFFCLAYTFSLKMEAVCFSETSVTFTRLHSGTSQTITRFDFWLLGWLLFGPEDGSSAFLENNGKLLQRYIVLLRTSLFLLLFLFISILNESEVANLIHAGCVAYPVPSALMLADVHFAYNICFLRVALIISPDGIDQLALREARHTAYCVR